jgi:limonene-1,2-epoxide hydrolase
MTTEIAPGTTTDAPSEPSAQQVVEAFISALERLDLDGAAALVSDDIRWVNVPWKSSSNKHGFKKVLGAMFKDATRFEVQYSDIHERGDGVVYTDRVDIFEGGGPRQGWPGDRLGRPVQLGHADRRSGPESTWNRQVSIRPIVLRKSEYGNLLAAARVRLTSSQMPASKRSVL